jgi:hypothetical protein
MGTRSVRSWILAAVLAAAPAAAAEQVEAVPHRVTVTLKDGGRLVGTIVSEDETALTLLTAAGLELRLVRDAIASVTPGSDARGAGRPELGDPNDTRLMFAPTGRPLARGNGYFSDHYVLFPGFAYGLTDNLSLSGGVSTIPTLGLADQLFYVSTQLGFQPTEKIAFSIGGLYAGGTQESLGAGVLYGVTTLGRPERSLTVGLALGAVRDEEDLANEHGEFIGRTTRWRSRPIVMAGGTFRLARRASLVSENWFFVDRPLSQQTFGLALRLFSDRISVDVGFLIVPGIIDEGFPIPWLSFSYHFGPSRASRRPGAAEHVSLPPRPSRR